MPDVWSWANICHDGSRRTDRHIVLVVNKEEEKRWGKLVAGKAPTFVKVDWDKWVDSDDEDAGPPGGFGGFDMSQFDNFQNWDDEGDSGAMAEDSDDDDEDLPDLEK